VCAVAVSGATQTQILGISFGATMTDKNCERLKLARSVYDMGMKVAAVSIMCQDERVFTAMSNAGTPCPVDGKIGEQAKQIWEAEPQRQPQKVKSKD
jgi:metal-sulfur cluster biosynthetic enzyme